MIRFGKNIGSMIAVLYTFGLLYSVLEPLYVDKTLDFKLLLKAVLNVITGDTWAHMRYIYIV